MKAASARTPGRAAAAEVPKAAEPRVRGDLPAGGLHFRKAQGAGNDFILISGPVAPAGLSSLARELCRRQTGIGADGLVVITQMATGPAAYDVRCFNPDGSEATMCGNALRCAALSTAADHGHAEVDLHMAGVWHRGSAGGPEAAVTAQAGPVLRAAATIDYDGQAPEFDAVHTGTEHVVAFVDDVDAVSVGPFGRHVRYHERFAPRGTNVSFVQAPSPDRLRIRTYERGVEAETLSCGSDAVAAVVAARTRRLVGDGAVAVENRAGEPLTVWPDARGDGTFWISGPAAIVFRGEI
jgi:diaminopimelate epimerase